MLVEKGVQLVLAMRHSISRRATSLFMKRFYEQLFQKKSVEESIVLARQDLFGDKSRFIGGSSFELEDWVLPIIHANRDVTFDIREFETEEEELTYYTAIDQRPHFPYDFNLYKGIDLDLLKMGNLLQTQQHLVLTAKDTKRLSLFTQYAMAYWTRFHLVESALAFSCSEGLTLQEMVEVLSEGLITDPSELIEFESKPFVLQKKQNTGISAFPKNFCFSSTMQTCWQKNLQSRPVRHSKVSNTNQYQLCTLHGSRFFQTPMAKIFQKQKTMSMRHLDTKIGREQAFPLQYPPKLLQ